MRAGGEPADRRSETGTKVLVGTDERFCAAASRWWSVGRIEGSGAGRTGALPRECAGAGRVAGVAARRLLRDGPPGQRCRRSSSERSVPGHSLGGADEAVVGELGGGSSGVAGDVADGEVEVEVVAVPGAGAGSVVAAGGTYSGGVGGDGGCGGPSSAGSRRGRRACLPPVTSTACAAPSAPAPRPDG
jgi:hypothetical protein